MSTSFQHPDEIHLNSGGVYKDVSAGVMNWVDGYETFCVQLEEYVSGGNSYAYDVLEVAEEPDAKPRPFRSRSGRSFTTAVTIPPAG